MELKLPIELEEMIQDGFWPSSSEATRQNLQPIIPKDYIRRFAPEKENLYLYPPPFLTIQQRMTGGEHGFWSDPTASLHEIDPKLALDIGDFGLGSDAPIILDYRRDRSNPSVLRLRWSTDMTKPKFTDNHWIKIADTFAEFATFLRPPAR